VDADRGQDVSADLQYSAMDALEGILSFGFVVGEHDDRKLDNLEVKVIDLGLTQHFPDGDFRCLLGRVGKLQYMCPEAYARQPYDARKADVYCLGVMLFMMLIGAPPYQAPQIQNAAFKYISSGRVADVLKHWKRLRLLSEDAVDLLNNMLCYEPKRFSMAEVLKHPFLTGIDNEAMEMSHGDQGNEVDDVKEREQNVVPSASIEHGVSEMSMDDNNQPSKPGVGHHHHHRVKDPQEIDRKEESIGDNGNGNGNRCVELLTKWGLMEIYDVLHATGWDHPDDWHKLDVIVLQWEINIAKPQAQRFIDCFNAEFGDDGKQKKNGGKGTGTGTGGGGHPHNDHGHQGGSGGHHGHLQHGGGVNQNPQGNHLYGHHNQGQPPHGHQQGHFHAEVHPQGGQQQQVHYQQDAYQNHHINRPNHPHQFEHFHYY